MYTSLSLANAKKDEHQHKHHTASSKTSKIYERWYTAKDIKQGQSYYMANCSVCHGLNAEGTKEWKKRTASGHLPPPPLNGTAHTWHHPMSVLVDVILNGGGQYGGIMPGFKGALDEQKAKSIVAFLQSHWDDEVFAKWYELEHEL